MEKRETQFVCGSDFEEKSSKPQSFLTSIIDCLHQQII